MSNTATIAVKQKRVERTIRLVLYALFFASGISGLVYEIIWMRKLGLVFGNTVYATSSVLTAFMGGLALGSFLIGRLADRSRNLFRLYALLELGIGLSVVLLMFFFLRVMDGIYVWSYRHLEAGPLAFNLVRFFMAVIILIVPTTLMGGTLPVISKLLIHQKQSLGLGIGNLYALNTLGGMLGCFITGFFLIRIFGETAATLLAAAINVVIAFVLLRLERIVTQPASLPTGSQASRVLSVAAENRVTESTSGRRALALLIIFGIGGFTSLAYEVVWTRALLFFVSSRVYSFSTILTTFLGGIMFGSFVMARRVDRVKRPFLLLGFAEIIIGLTALVTIPTIQHLQDFNLWVGSKLGIPGWTGTVFILFGTCALVLLLPTVLMGAVFPLVNRMYATTLSDLGRRVGEVYSVNTVGAIVGSFLAGFVIMPALGIGRSILLLAGFNLGIGIWALALETSGQSLKQIRGAIAVCVAALFVVAVLTFDAHRPLVASHPIFVGNRIQYYKDTNSGSLSVLENIEEIGLWGRNVKFLNINGNNTAQTTFADIIVHKMLAHVPMLLHPSPQEVLVVGFGFGSTSRSILAYEADYVDCVELIGEEKETAKFFLPENRDVLANPRFHFIVNDGRNYLLATPKQYDVISFNAIDPKMSPALYTKDFYELCRARLKKDGIIAAWLPFYGLEPRENLALIRSFIEVFPHASLWYCNPEHYVLVGSVAPLAVDLNKVKARFSTTSVQQDLQEIHLENIYAFLATCIAGEHGLRRMVNDIPLNTDLHPVVEFSQVSVPRTFAEAYQALLAQLEPFPAGMELVKPNAADSIMITEVRRFAASTIAMLNALALYEKSLWEQNPTLRSEAYEQARQTVRENPDHHLNLLQFVDLVQQTEIEGNLDIFQKAVEIEPQFAKAHVLKGMVLLGKGEADEAIASFRQALAINPAYVAANFNLGIALEMKKDWAGAISAYEQGLKLKDDFQVQSSVSKAYAYLGDLDKAIFHGQKALELEPRNSPAYFNLGVFLEKQGKIPEAIRAFERGLKFSPDDARARSYLEKLKSM
jgi:spermidine synthase